MSNRQVHIQMVVPFTNVVKWLVISNVSIWLVVQVILGKSFLPGLITPLFGLVPARVIGSFFIWQPVTYMFLHSVDQITHLLFNMLMLWFLGAELEMRWGSRFFLIYYMVSGIGAAIIYVLTLAIYSIFSENLISLQIPVIGASGAVFGLMVAYGIIFGERIVYFMFLFPMRAKYFVMILGGLELMTLLNTGVVGGNVANLAHLGGLISGFCFLIFWTRYQQGRLKKGPRSKGGNLRLIVNNDKNDQKNDPSGGPKYWH